MKQQISSDNSLDPTDLSILSELQADSSLSNVELARRVNLSPPATHTRVKRLEQLGYIQQYAALLNREKLGYDLLCFITVSLQSHQTTTTSNFRRAVQQMPEVLECYQVTGDYDYILKVVIRNRDDLRRFLMDQLTAIEGVAQIYTRIALDDLKSTTVLPLDN